MKIESKQLSRQQFLSFIGAVIATELMATKEAKNINSVSMFLANSDNASKDLEHLLYSYTTSNDLWKNAVASRKAIYTLANVYEQSELPARNYSRRQTQLLNSLSDEANPQLSQNTYARFPEFLGGGEGVPTAYEKFLEIGGLSAATAGVITAGAAAGLGIAAILVEPLLTYLSQPGLNMSISFLPPTDPIQTDSLNKAMFFRAAEIAEDNRTIERMLSNDVVKINLGVKTDINDSATEMSERLPNNIKESVSKAIDKKPSKITDEQKKVIADLLKTELNNQWETSKKIQLELYNQSVITMNALAKQKVKDQMEFESREMTGMIQIGGFVIGQIIGDKKGAAFFTTCAIAFQQIHEASFKYVNGAIGGLAFGGAIVTSIVSIMSIGQPSETELILDSLNKIKDLVVELGKGLNMILQGEQLIFKQITFGFELMQQDFNEMRARFSVIQHDILQLSKSSVNIQYDSRYHDFRGTVNDLKVLIQNSTQEERISILYKQNYQRSITALFNYSTETAKQFSLTGDHTLIHQFSDIDGVIKTRPYADLLFGILEKICAIAEITVNYPRNIKSPEGIVPNPIAWAHGTLGLIEARTLEAGIILPSDKTQLTVLWSEGIRLKEIVRISTEKKTIGFFISKYELVATPSTPSSAKLPGIINDLIMEFDKKFLTNFIVETLPPSWKLDGSTFYLTPAENTKVGTAGLFKNALQRNETDKWYKVTEDPLDLAIKNKLIEKVLISSRTWHYDNAHPNFDAHINFYQLLIKEGPEKGEFLLGTDSKLCEVTFLTDGNFSGMSRNWNPIDSGTIHLIFGNVGGNPLPLLEECRRLNRWFTDSKTIKSQLPKFLEQQITSLDMTSTDGLPSIIKQLQGIGSVLKLLLTIKQWRRNTSPTIKNFELAPDITYIENIGGITSKEGLLYSLTAIIENLEWKKSAIYSVEIANLLVNELTRTVEYFKLLAGDMDAQKGVYEIDETLKRLAGYMKIYDIQFELPERTS